jgi:FkbM family methyltransferase
MSRKREIADILEKIFRVRMAAKGSVGPLLEEDYLERFTSTYQIDCVFDIGANEGQYASKLRRKLNYEGLIISFEPVPDVAKVLKARAARDPKWIVAELALDNSVHDATFKIMHRSTFSSLHNPSKNIDQQFAGMNKVIQEIKLTTDTLDNAYKRYKQKLGFTKPFLKIDTQGNDVRVVQGAAGCIGEFFGLQSELSFRPIYEETIGYGATLDYYASLGFELGALVPNNAGHFPRLFEMDCIMYNPARLGLPSLSSLVKAEA